MRVFFITVRGVKSRNDRFGLPDDLSKDSGV
jgi:hypothetical protein